MTLRDRSILVVSTEPWFGPLLSKQYVALELSRHNRVLFIDPAYNVADLARRRNLRRDLRQMSIKHGLGDSTAFAVHVEIAATHITMNPVAVNMQCHSARRATAAFTPAGVEYGF